MSTTSSENPIDDNKCLCRDKDKIVPHKENVRCFSSNVIEHEDDIDYFRRCTICFPLRYRKQMFFLDENKIKDFNAKIFIKFEFGNDNVETFEKLEECLKNDEIIEFGIQYEKCQFSSFLFDFFLDQSIVLKNPCKIPIFECIMYDLMELLMCKNMPEDITLSDFFIDQDAGLTKPFGKVQLFIDVSKPKFDVLQKNNEMKRVTLQTIVKLMKEIQILVGENQPYSLFNKFVNDLGEKKTIEEIKNTEFYKQCHHRRKREEIEKENIKKQFYAAEGGMSHVDFATYIDTNSKTEYQVVIKTPLSKAESDVVLAVVQHQREGNCAWAFQGIPNIMRTYGKISLKIDRNVKIGKLKDKTKYRDFYCTKLNFVSKNVNVYYQFDLGDYIKKNIPYLPNSEDEVSPVFFFGNIELHLKQIADLLISTTSLAEMNIYSKDYKPGNFFVNDENRVIMGDLGGLFLQATKSMSEEKMEYGTEFYKANEQNLGGYDLTYCDIHALGWILIQYIGIKEVFSLYNDVIHDPSVKNINQGVYEKIHQSYKEYKRFYMEDYTSRSGYEIILRCFEYLNCLETICGKMTQYYPDQRCGWVPIHQLLDETLSLMQELNIHYFPIQMKHQVLFLKDVLFSSFSVCDEIISFYNCGMPLQLYEAKNLFHQDLSNKYYDVNGNKKPFDEEREKRIIYEYDSKKLSTLSTQKKPYEDEILNKEFFKILIDGHLSLAFVCIDNEDVEHLKQLIQSIKMILSFHPFNTISDKKYLSSISNYLKSMHEFIMDMSKIYETN